MSEAVATLDAIPSVERTRLVDQVTHKLRELILTNRLAPGTRLLQVELSEQLGVSRTPLREAIRLLEQDGLVRVVNGNRTVEVVSFTPEALREQYEIREVVDGLAARLVAQRHIGEAFDEQLEAQLAEMREATHPFDGERYLLAHVAFHASIVQECGNSRLQGLLPLVRTTAASLRSEFKRHLVEDERTRVHRIIQGSDASHRVIYEAIKSGNPDEAERAARGHIATTLEVNDFGDFGDFGRSGVSRESSSRALAT